MQMDKLTKLPYEIIDHIFRMLPLKERIRLARIFLTFPNTYYKNIIFDGLIRDLYKVYKLKAVRSKHSKWPLGLYESTIYKKVCERCLSKPDGGRLQIVPLYPERPFFVFSGCWLCDGCINEYILNVKLLKEKLGAKLMNIFIEEYSTPFLLSNGHWYPSILKSSLDSFLKNHTKELQAIDKRKAAKQKQKEKDFSLVQSWFPEVDLSKCPSCLELKGFKKIENKEFIKKAIRHEWTYFKMREDALQLLTGQDLQRFNSRVPQCNQFGTMWFFTTLTNMLNRMPDTAINDFRIKFQQLFPGEADRLLVPLDNNWATQ